MQMSNCHLNGKFVVKMTGHQIIKFTAQSKFIIKSANDLISTKFTTQVDCDVLHQRSKFRELTVRRKSRNHLLP